MYRFQDVQNHINRLRQDLSTISQTALQLQQAEQQAQSQLARLSQHESMNSQQLQRISQICLNLQNDLSAISSVVQQMSSAVPAYGGAGATQFGATGITTGTAAPYTGFTSGAAVTPYTGFASTAPLATSAASGLTTANVPNINVNLPAAATTAGTAYGGMYAHRPWVEKDHPPYSQSFGAAPLATNVSAF